MGLNLETKYGNYSRNAVASSFRMPDAGYRGGPVAIPEDYKAKVDVPEDYKFNITDPGVIAPTPQTKFSYMSPELGGGQYAYDPTTKGLIKSERQPITPQRQMLNDMVRGGLSSSRIELDHILPLWAGGVDTPYNLQGLAKPDHDKKSKTSAVARTLYWNGEITLEQAQAAVFGWKDKNIEDLATVPLVGQFDEVPLEIAREVYSTWDEPTKVGISDMIKVMLSRTPLVGKAISKMIGYEPDTAEQMFEEELKKGPESDFGQVVQSIVSPLTLGWAPHPEGRGDEGLGTNIAKIGGGIAGFIASYMFFVGMVKGALATTKIGAIWKGKDVLTAGKAATGGRTAQLMAKNAAVLKAVKALNTSTRIQQLVAKGLTSRAGTWLLTGGVPKAAQFGKFSLLPSGARIGAMLTEAGLFSAFGQLQTPEGEETFNNRVDKFITDAAYGSVFGAISGGKLKDYGILGMGSYMIGKYDGLSDEDAMTNAMMMMGLHGAFQAAPKLFGAERGAAFNKKGGAMILEQVIEKNLYLSARNARNRISEKLPGLRMPDIVPGRSITAEEYIRGIANASREADRRFLHTQDPFELRALQTDIGLTYQWLRLNGLSVKERYDAMGKDLFNQFLRLGEERPGNLETIPGWLKEWGALPENQPSITAGVPVVGDRLPVPRDREAPVGTMQVTGTSQDVSLIPAKSIERLLPQSGPGIQVFLVPRPDTTSYFERMNRLISELVAPGKQKPVDNPGKSVQIVGFDPQTGEALHLGWLPSEGRIGAVARDAEGNITGPSAEASVTSMNKMIEKYRNQGRDIKYIDPKTMSKDTVFDYMSDMNADAAPAFLRSAGTTGRESGKAYVVLDITPTTYERALSKDVLPRTPEQMIEQATEAAELNIARRDESPTGQDLIFKNREKIVESGEELSKTMDVIAKGDELEVMKFNNKMSAEEGQKILDFDPETGNLKLNDGTTKPVDKVTTGDVIGEFNIAQKNEKLSEAGENYYSKILGYAKELNEKDPLTWRELVNKPVAMPVSPEVTAAMPPKAVLHSGARKGTESFFGQVAEAFGLGEKNYVSKKSQNILKRRPDTSLEVIPEGKVDQYSALYKNAAKRLGEPVPKDPITQNNLKMDAYKIRNADQVFAVGEIVAGGKIKGTTKFSIEMAKSMKKDIYLYDQGRKSWYKFDYEGGGILAEPGKQGELGKWAKVPEKEVVINTPNFAGVGTIEINQSGMNAIMKLYQRSFPDGLVGKLPDTFLETAAPQVSAEIKFGEVPKEVPKMIEGSASEQAKVILKQLNELERKYRLRYLKKTKRTETNFAGDEVEVIEYVPKEKPKKLNEKQQRRSQGREQERIVMLLELRKLNKQYTELVRKSAPPPLKKAEYTEIQADKRRQAEDTAGLAKDLEIKRQIAAPNEKMETDMVGFSTRKMEIENDVRNISERKGFSDKDTSDAVEMALKGFQSGDPFVYVNFRNRFGWSLRDLQPFGGQRIGYEHSKVAIEKAIKDMSLKNKFSEKETAEAVELAMEGLNAGDIAIFPRFENLYGWKLGDIKLPGGKKLSVNRQALANLSGQVESASKVLKDKVPTTLWNRFSKAMDKKRPMWKHPEAVILNDPKSTYSFDYLYRDTFPSGKMAGIEKTHNKELLRLSSVVQFSNVNYAKWSRKLPKELRDQLDAVRKKHPYANIYGTPSAAVYKNKDVSYNFFPKIDAFFKKSQKKYRMIEEKMTEENAREAAGFGQKWDTGLTESRKKEIYSGETESSLRSQEDDIYAAMDKILETGKYEKDYEPDAVVDAFRKATQGIEEGSKGEGERVQNLLSSQKTEQHLMESESGNVISMAIAPLRIFNKKELGTAEVEWVADQLANLISRKMATPKKPKAPKKPKDYKIVGKKPTPKPPTNEQMNFKVKDGKPVGTYEVSSKGDKRFSALNAKFNSGQYKGRTIEDVYQTTLKGSGKNKPPAPGSPLYGKPVEESYRMYKGLWEQWAKENPALINDLIAKSGGKKLTDQFAKTNVNQARALEEIIAAKNKTTDLPFKVIGKTPIKIIEKTDMKAAPKASEVEKDRRIPASSSRSKREIYLDEPEMKEKYKDKAWTTPKVKGASGYPKTLFKNYKEWRKFIVEHEKAHIEEPKQLKGESDGAYEDRVSRVAMKEMGERFKKYSFPFGGKKLRDMPISDPLESILKKNNIYLQGSDKDAVSRALAESNKNTAKLIIDDYIGRSGIELREPAIKNAFEIAWDTPKTRDYYQKWAKGVPSSQLKSAANEWLGVGLNRKPDVKIKSLGRGSPGVKRGKYNVTKKILTVEEEAAAELAKMKYRKDYYGKLKKEKFKKQYAKLRYESRKMVNAGKITESEHKASLEAAKEKLLPGRRVANPVKTKAFYYFRIDVKAELKDLLNKREITQDAYNKALNDVEKFIAESTVDPKAGTAKEFAKKITQAEAPEQVLPAAAEKVAPKIKSIERQALEKEAKKIKLPLGKVGVEAGDNRLYSLCNKTARATVNNLEKAGYDASVIRIVAKSPVGDFTIDHYVAQVKINGKQYIVDDPQFRFLGNKTENVGWQDAVTPNGYGFNGSLKELGTIITPMEFPGILTKNGAMTDFGEAIKATKIKKEGNYTYGEYNGTKVRYDEGTGEIQYSPKNVATWIKENFEPEVFKKTPATLESYKKGENPLD